MWVGRTHFEVADVAVVHQTLYVFLLEIQGSVCVVCLFVCLFVCLCAYFSITPMTS